MGWVDKDEYSKVDTAKMLDTADALEKAVGKILDALSAIDDAVDGIESNEDNWSGDAATQWDDQYTKTRNQLSEDIDKYNIFVKYIRERVEVYIQGAIDAEQTASEMNQDVRALLNTLLEDTGGNATVGALHKAHLTLSQED